MESNVTVNALSTTTAVATATTLTTSTSAATIATTTTANCSHTNSSNTKTHIATSNSAATTTFATSIALGLQMNLPVGAQQSLQLSQQQLHATTGDNTKHEDTNNSSLASAISEGPRSISAAPSASSSPILSPPGKIFGRNSNGTMVATSRPSNEAEIQLYRVLQRASLLSYYDTLLEMGGDDVQQLYDAGEEEFLEIMALVGMASKPLHVRRLQKSLHEWANNPSSFQGPMLANTPGLCETPTKPIVVINPEKSPTFPRGKFPTFNSTPAFNPTPLINTAQTNTSHMLTQICTPAIPLPIVRPQTSLSLPTTMSTSTLPSSLPPLGPGTSHQVSSSSPQLTPVLTELQVARIAMGAEKIARQLPQREPRAQTSKKRTSRELELVIAMSENDPRRMDEIRKYSAIYGRFDCKRRPEKPLTLHEVCVNEAAGQLCRLVPALLTRRDELFPLARQIVKDAGFGHSATIARYGTLVPQIQAQTAAQRSITVSLESCESSDSTVTTVKRQRLSSTETISTPDLNRESTTEDSRYNLFAMYHKFAKPPFDLTEIGKFSLSKSECDDNDSRFSFSTSSSPSIPNTGSENERDLGENSKSITTDEAHSTAMHIKLANRSVVVPDSETTTMLDASSYGGVQIISAAGEHIIAVANPALALSPTFNEALSMKRETTTPDI